MKIYKITEASEYLGVSTMPNLDEIKARREKINGASWKAVEGNSNDIRSSVFAGNDLLATLSSWKRHEYADFIANTPTDIDWLVGEVERLRLKCGEASPEGVLISD